jgi:hypothetical protein
MPDLDHKSKSPKKPFSPPNPIGRIDDTAYRYDECFKPLIAVFGEQNLMETRRQALKEKKLLTMTCFGELAGARVTVLLEFDGR